MEGPKITITVTEEDGKQTVINADFAIICAHSEGEPKNNLEALCAGKTNPLVVAYAFNDIQNLRARIAAADPMILAAMMVVSKQDRNRNVESERFEVIRKED